MQTLIDCLCETFQLLSGVLVKLMAILFYFFPTINKQRYIKSIKMCGPTHNYINKCLGIN